jgi:FeoC like transcriptional regulator.
MILRDLKDYMIHHNTVSLMDLVNHFDTDSIVIEQMLARWVKKDMIEVLNNEQDGKGCGTTCYKCDERTLKFYKWRISD